MVVMSRGNYATGEMEGLIDTRTSAVQGADGVAIDENLAAAVKIIEIENVEVTSLEGRLKSVRDARASWFKVKAVYPQHKDCNNLGQGVVSSSFLKPCILKSTNIQWLGIFPPSQVNKMGSGPEFRNLSTRLGHLLRT